MSFFLMFSTRFISGKIFQDPACTLRIRRTRKKVPTEWVDTNLFGASFAQQCADPSAHQREERCRGCDRHAGKQRALLCRDASIALIRTMCRIIGIGSVGRLFWLNGVFAFIDDRDHPDCGGAVAFLIADGVSQGVCACG